MLKRFTLLCCCLLSLYGLQAQGGDLKIGARIAPAFASTIVLDASSKEVLELNQTGVGGYEFGIVGNYFFADNYAFYTGAHIIQRGFAFDRDSVARFTATDTSFATESFRNQITTLSFPLGIKLQTNELGSGWRVTGHFGATIDLNLGLKQTISASDAEDVINRRSNQINPLAGTFMVGAGAEYALSSGAVGIDLTYHHGLANINNKKNGINNGIVRLNHISLGATYFF